MKHSSSSSQEFSWMPGCKSTACCQTVTCILIGFPQWGKYPVIFPFKQQEHGSCVSMLQATGWREESEGEVWWYIWCNETQQIFGTNTTKEEGYSWW